jgi:hypothetical protein
MPFEIPFELPIIDRRLKCYCPDLFSAGCQGSLHPIRTSIVQPKSTAEYIQATSRAPFAPRAMDRGLTGAMVSLLRLSDESLNPNLGAGQLKAVGNGRISNTRNVNHSELKVAPL